MTERIMRGLYQIRHAAFRIHHGVYVPSRERILYLKS